MVAGGSISVFQSPPRTPLILGEREREREREREGEREREIRPYRLSDITNHSKQRPVSVTHNEHD